MKGFWKEMERVWKDMKICKDFERKYKEKNGIGRILKRTARMLKGNGRILKRQRFYFERR